MKKSLAFLIVICLLMILAGCENSSGSATAEAADPIRNAENNSGAANDFISATSEIAEEPPAPSNTGQPPETQAESSVTGEEPDMFKIEVLIGNETYTATLYENETTRALMEMLPLTLDMSELNGNEKYHYLDTGLPANADKPSGIQTGDLMLFGDRCLVLFYESFSTSYTYTPLGRIDAPAGLAAALGSGNVQVTFRKG